MINSIKNDDLIVSVKSLGAELTSIKTARDNKEFLWQSDARYWKGQAPVLFPVVGGLPDDKYTLGGKTYEMKPHGFAWVSEFDLVKKTQTELSYRLGHSEKTFMQYPFKFELHTAYKLEKNILRHSFRVYNLDEKTMLFSVGAHTGIKCPFNENETMNDYFLAFEKDEELQMRIKKVLLTGEREGFMSGERVKALSYSLFYNGACILDGVRSEWLEMRSSANSRIVKFNFKGFPYLGIWSADNNAPYLCIEPWYGIDSTVGDPYDFEMKEGLQKLSPGCSFECEYTIEIT